MTEKRAIEPLAFSPNDTAQRLSISLRAVYTLISTGELRSFKIGKRRLISDHELQHLMQRKLVEAAK